LLKFLHIGGEEKKEHAAVWFLLRETLLYSNAGRKRGTLELRSCKLKIFKKRKVAAL